MLLQLFESLAQVLHDIFLLCQARSLAALHILTLYCRSDTLTAYRIFSVAFDFLALAAKTLCWSVSEGLQLVVAAPSTYGKLHRHCSMVVATADVFSGSGRVDWTLGMPVYFPKVLMMFRVR
jgi:hypothetical protein